MSILSIFLIGAVFCLMIIGLACYVAGKLIDSEVSWILRNKKK